MRVAALYDVHGNLPALEAVLEDVQRAEVDVVLVGGDLAAGPFPAGTLEALRRLGERARFVRGNADREVAAPTQKGVNEAAARALTWTASQLSDEQRGFLGSLPEAQVLEVAGLGPTLFCHGSPRDDEEILTRATSPERLAPILAGVEQRTVVCGHTHVQFDRVIGRVRLVNAGSVGMPYEGEPGAYWALLGPDVELRRTDYDVQAAAIAVRASGYPDAVGFARENLLAPPSAEEATSFFEQLASGAPA